MLVRIEDTSVQNPVYYELPIETQDHELTIQVEHSNAIILDNDQRPVLSRALERYEWVRFLNDSIPGSPPEWYLVTSPEGVTQVNITAAGYNPPVRWRSIARSTSEVSYLVLTGDGKVHSPMGTMMCPTCGPCFTGSGLPEHVCPTVAKTAWDRLLDEDSV